ncbi:MAG: NAD(P)-binding protein [Pseudomonadota bacterium]
MHNSDRELGMERRISRRDFVQGTLAGGTLAASGVQAQTGPETPVYYPPGETGLRGSHEGSYEEAHAHTWQGQQAGGGAVVDLDAQYDLIVVGAGISGLAAAYFYRRERPDARILILDNHDDFGGHAKRNEFKVDGREIIAYGGSQSLEAPGDYSEVSQRLLRELSIKPDEFYEHFDQDFYSRHGLTSQIYFDKETYGAAALVPAESILSSGMLGVDSAGLSPAEAIARMPLDAQARAQLLDLVEARRDALSDMGIRAAMDYLWSISYETFLTRHVGVTSPQLLALLRRMTTGYFGLGTDASTAIESMVLGLPGLNKNGVWGAQWLARRAVGMAEPYIFHFPDGNATVARLLVRSLIPEVSDRPGHDMVHARLDYSRLDVPTHNVHLRLSSTAVRVQNIDGRVEVLYRRAGQTCRARAKRGVLACYNMMIPYLAPELAASQKKALAMGVKVPLVYSNVVLRNWRALQAKRAGFVHTPNSFHSYFMVDFPVSMGAYQFARTPDEPMVLHFSEALIQPGLPARDQHRAGRARLLATTYTDIERDLRQTLVGVLEGTEFDPGRDIAGITVNRWPHGYAYSPSPLFDPEYPPGEAPHEIGRATFGNIAIANSDAGGRAYLDEAIDQAHRAVGEII